MKIARPATRTRTDPRAVPLPLQLDDQGLASRVQSCRTAEEAWKLLSDIPASPETLERLSAAAVDCCQASDAIGRGLVAFGTLPPDADVPDGWVDRMVELYRAYLEGYWRLDDLAWEGLADGGWTVTSREPLADDLAGRIAQRARWVAEEIPREKPTLAVDRARHALGDIAGLVTPDDQGLMTLDDVRNAGHALVAACVHHRFSHWQQSRLAAHR